MRLELELPDELEDDLKSVARESRISCAVWAAEAVWSALASRRLPKVKPSVQCGRHNGTATGRDAEHETEPEGFPVHCRINGGEMEFL